MKILTTMLLAAMVSSCTSRIAVPRSEALCIAEEIVSRQRLERAKSEANANEPDLVVTDVLPVDGRDDLVVAVCEYRFPGQGYALLVRRDVFPFEELVMFGGDQYQRVESVTSRRIPDGTVITVSHETLRGNNTGTEELLVRTDGSLKWLRKKR